MHICSYIFSFRSPSFIQNDYAKAGAGYAKGVENFKGVSHIFNSFLLSRLPLYFCSYLFFHNFNGQGSVCRFLQSARIFFAYIHIPVHKHTYMHIHVFVYIYIHIHLHTHIHIHIHSVNLVCGETSSHQKLVWCI